MDELIVDYWILAEPCYIDLQAVVLAAMQDGWQPLGGVNCCEQERASEEPFTDPKYHARKFLQTMVKYEE